MRATIEKLKEKPESYRHKVSVITAATLAIAIAIAWAGIEGYIGLPTGTSQSNITAESRTREASQTATVSASSPLENSKSALSATFSKIGEKFAGIKEAMANVFVPFVSGIEVYESK